MDRYVYQDPITEEISVVCPAPKEDIERNLKRFLSDAEYDAMVYDHSIARPIREGLINPQVEVKKIPEEIIPKDREFRGAWKLSGDAVVEDLEKAKVIKLERIRAEREPLLADLDKQFMQAIERGNDAERARVIAEKQKLRDVTEPLKDATIKSVDELRGKTLQDFLQG